MLLGLDSVKDRAVALFDLDFNVASRITRLHAQVWFVQGSHVALLGSCRFRCVCGAGNADLRKICRSRFCS